MTEATSSEEKVAKEEGVISARSVKSGKEATITKDFGATLDAARTEYGDDTILAVFKRQAVINCQARMRGVLDKGGSVEEAQAAGENFTPGVVTRRAAASKDPKEQILKILGSGQLSIEDIQAIMNEEGMN